MLEEETLVVVKYFKRFVLKLDCSEHLEGVGIHGDALIEDDDPLVINEISE